MHDGLHGASTKTGFIALEVGYYAVELEYFERGGDHTLDWNWRGPGFQDQPAPASVLWHQK